MTRDSLYSTLDRSDDTILALLADGNSPTDVAMHFCDQDVSAGEYGAEDFEIDLAANQYQQRAERLLREAGGK